MHNSAVAKLNHIVDTADRWGQQRQGEPTRAGTADPMCEIAQPVIEQDRGAINEVGYDYLPGLSHPSGHAILIYNSDWIQIRVNVVALLLVALEANLERFHCAINRKNGDAEFLREERANRGRQ